MSSTSPSQRRKSCARGALHSELEGAPVRFRFRPERILSSRLDGRLTASFQVEDRGFVAKLADVSAGGACLHWGDSLVSGSRLDDFRIRLADDELWRGEAEVVHAGGSGPGTLGVRLIGPMLDLAEVEFRDQCIHGSLLPSLRSWTEAKELPIAWRADLLSYYQLLIHARHVLRDAERADATGAWRDPARSSQICNALFDAWNPSVVSVLRRLDRRSRDLPADRREDALRYAQLLIQDQFRHCEFLTRAYEKPRGYAGDYRMMELVQMTELEGGTLYQRFLHLYAKSNPLGRTISTRGSVAREVVEQVLNQGGPARILSLACGPALELRRALADHKRFEHPVDIYLVDQDEEALAYCHNGLSRVLAERGDEPPVTLHCLHFSLRQVTRPKTAAERELVKRLLTDVDLIYSMGMYDYLEQPIARRITTRIYDLLGPGGRLLIGNLMDVPESTWVMEFGMAWHLHYREEADMFDLAAEVAADAHVIDVVRDATGNCLFLDVIRRAVD